MWKRTGAQLFAHQDAAFNAWLRTTQAWESVAVDMGGSNQRSIYFAGRDLNGNNFTCDGIDATDIVN